MLLKYMLRSVTNLTLRRSGAVRYLCQAVSVFGLKAKHWQAEPKESNSVKLFRN